MCLPDVLLNIDIAIELIILFAIYEKNLNTRYYAELFMKCHFLIMSHLPRLPMS